MINASSKNRVFIEKFKRKMYLSKENERRDYVAEFM